MVHLQLEHEHLLGTPYAVLGLLENHRPVRRHALGQTRDLALEHLPEIAVANQFGVHAHRLLRHLQSRKLPCLGLGLPIVHLFHRFLQTRIEVNHLEHTVRVILITESDVISGRHTFAFAAPYRSPLFKLPDVSTIGTFSIGDVQIPFFRRFDKGVFTRYTSNRNAQVVVIRAPHSVLFPHLELINVVTADHHPDCRFCCLHFNG
mmetsp:Transcript_2794/g.5789  ORF Transcript_2794/g.5789 Transcript_2794/m.5789 type:complete len:205 (-) Transcript_2794:424-1038(-)